MKVGTLEENNEQLAQKAMQSVKAAENIKTKYGKDFELLDIAEGDLFFQAISMLSTQQKAPLAEKFLSNTLGWNIVHASSDRGDFYDPINDKYIELKASFTNKGNNLNLRQIRPWQEVDEYVCLYIDEINPDESILFLLTKDEMLEEIENHGSNTHGTKTSNMVNVNHEISITVPIDSKKAMYNRWLASYGNTELLERIMKDENGKS